MTVKTTKARIGKPQVEIKRELFTINDDDSDRRIAYRRHEGWKVLGMFSDKPGLFWVMFEKVTGKVID